MITSIYAGILGLMLISLSINVIRSRRKYRTAIGDANNIQMTRCIRAQSNLTEYSPVFLILLGLSEYNQIPWWALHGFGIFFILGRFMHAYSLLWAEKYDNYKLIAFPAWRIRGMILTFISIGSLSIISLIKGLL